MTRKSWPLVALYVNVLLAPLLVVGWSIQGDFHAAAVAGMLWFFFYQGYRRRLESGIDGLSLATAQPTAH